jgi:hypothetical protein
MMSLSHTAAAAAAATTTNALANAATETFTEVRRTNRLSQGNPISKD